jgi:hypothetical protein
VITKADLMARVAKTLRIVDEDEDASDSQAATIYDAIDDVRAELLEQGRCWWDENNIPQAVAGPLRVLVAFECANTFGKQVDAQRVNLAEARLNRLKSSEERPQIVGTYY